MKKTRQNLMNHTVVLEIGDGLRARESMQILRHQSIEFVVLFQDHVSDSGIREFLFIHARPESRTERIVWRPNGERFIRLPPPNLIAGPPNLFKESIQIKTRPIEPDRPVRCCIDLPKH